MRLTGILALIAVGVVALSMGDGSSVGAITGPMGVIETYLGSSTADANTGDSGPATAAEIYKPGGIAVAANGDLYVTSGCSIRKVSVGVVTTVATLPDCSGLVPIAISPANEVYVGANCRVFRESAGAFVPVTGQPPTAAEGRERSMASRRLTPTFPGQRVWPSTLAATCSSPTGRPVGFAGSISRASSVQLREPASALR